MTSERIEELMDELFDAVSNLHHYTGGMLDDMKAKKYKIEEASADLAVFDNLGIGDILDELYELSKSSDNDITEELPITPALAGAVDVWTHYGERK